MPLLPKVAAVTVNVRVVLLPTEIVFAPNDLSRRGLFCPRSCADAGLANKNVISTPITVAHTVARLRHLCTAVAQDTARGAQLVERRSRKTAGRKPRDKRSRIEMHPHFIAASKDSGHAGKCNNQRSGRVSWLGNVAIARD
jgi:hypothetical protein